MLKQSSNELVWITVNLLQPTLCHILAAEIRCITFRENPHYVSLVFIVEAERTINFEIQFEYAKHLSVYKAVLPISHRFPENVGFGNTFFVINE